MQRWTVHLEGGPRRVNHAAVCIGQRIFSFGGYCTGEDYQTTRPMDIHVLNTMNYRWYLLPLPSKEDLEYHSVPYQRYGLTAVAHNDFAYIWGGRNDKDGACNILYCFDPSKHKWTLPEYAGETPGARDGHSACVVNDSMFIFGGYEEEIDKFSNQVHALDFNTMTWTMLNTSGVAARWRDFHSATAYGDSMYIFGGRSDGAGPIHTNNEIYCNKIQVFNTITKSWKEPKTTGTKPDGRRSHSAFVHGNSIYVFGGFNGLSQQHYDDLYKYDPEHYEWSLVKVNGTGPRRRRRQCCCVLQDTIFLFGGTSPRIDSETDSFDIDLIDQSDLHVLDFSPTLKTLCLLAVQDYKLDQSCLPSAIRDEIKSMTMNNSISRTLNSSG